MTHAAILDSKSRVSRLRLNVIFWLPHFKPYDSFTYYSRKYGLETQAHTLDDPPSAFENVSHLLPFSLSRTNWPRGCLASAQPFLRAVRANSNFRISVRFPCSPCCGTRRAAQVFEAVLCTLGLLHQPFSQRESAAVGRAELGAAGVERQAALAFQSDHVERPATSMMAILAQVFRENVGSSRHRCHVPFLTESLKIRVHLDNAA